MAWTNPGACGSDLVGHLIPGKTFFGALPDGREVHQIVLSDGTLSVALLSLGCILQDVRLAGVAHSLTIGTDDLAAYAGPMRSCGSLIGPVINRISGGTAELDGERFDFERNQDGQHTRHSGAAGTHRLTWDVAELDETSVTFETSLRDGEGGFPGNRVVAARFRLTDPGVLEMRVAVTTDAPTWVNFANHSYWNLDGTETYAGHRLQVAADRYCVPGPGDLVTGEVLPVDGTPFDFREGRVLSPGDDAKLDLNLCLADRRRDLTKVLELAGATGITMTIETTEPGLQLYDANGFTTGGAVGHDGRIYASYAGLAIEAQAWPDAPNQRRFPSTVLRPGRAYEQVTRWCFSRN